METLKLSPRDRVGAAAGAVLAGYRFLALAWMRAWPALAGAASGVVLASWSGRLVFVLVAILLWTLACGALWRLTQAEAPPRFQLLKPGGLELRLFACASLAAVFIGILFSLALVVLLAFAYAAASAGPGFVSSDVATWSHSATPAGARLVVGVAIVCGLSCLWAALRISLAFAATTARGRVQVLASWPLTRRRVLDQLLIRIALVSVPALLLGLAGMGPRWLTAVVAGPIAAGLWLPLTIGASAYLYRTLNSTDRLTIP